MPQIKKPKYIFEGFSVELVNIMGSWYSILLHTIWFILWFYYDLDIDMLTLIVSLEAIYLSIFILMASSTQMIHDRRRVLKDYQVDSKTYESIQKLHEKLDSLLPEDE